jgi:hypothetical protein
MTVETSGQVEMRGTVKWKEKTSHDEGSDGVGRSSSFGFARGFKGLVLGLSSTEVATPCLSVRDFEGLMGSFATGL